MNENQNEVVPETEEQTPPQTESPAPSQENNNFDSEINLKITNLKKEHGDKFNESGFREAAKKHAEAHGNLDGFDENGFLNDENLNNGKGQSFGLEQKDGKFIARGTDGTILEGKDFEEINDKVCENLKNHSLAHNHKGEPQICYNGKNPERQKIFSKNAITKHQMVIGQGWPEDKKWWQDLKADYIKDPNHNIKDWEKLTRKIPDSVMSRTPEERERNKKLNDAELLAKLRQGKNPNLTDTSRPATASRPNSNTNTGRLAPKPKGNDGY